MADAVAAPCLTTSVDEHCHMSTPRHRLLHRLSITPIFWLAFVISANAASVVIPVTPNTADGHKYVFTLSTNAAKGGIAFHVTITSKIGDFPFDSTAKLAIVTHRTNPDASVRRGSIQQAVNPTIRVTLKKDIRSWSADFTVSHKVLTKPGLCFVFTEFAHATIDGKRVAMPGADIYTLNLQDFLKQ
jgi:hypothetical protein